MIKNKFGEHIFNDGDIIDLYLKGHDFGAITKIMVDDSVNLETAASILENVPVFIRYDELAQERLTVEEFDQHCQSRWHMPDQYQHLDIAEYVLGLCENESQLQRCGRELLLFQERNLFDLLRYLKYLVDVMRENQLIWGVGRGSSVASYVLYKLGVHRIDSMFYDLDPEEFLR
jgi:DNA polymerase III alpha subunit